MNLSNPEKVVNEQRLSEFYGEILPYLGGMPEILANKFNRSDLFSTDEKIVGRWTDGKPLYQRSFLHASQQVINANEWTTIYTGSEIGDINKIVSATIQGGQGNAYSFGYFKANGNNLQVYFPLGAGGDITFAANTYYTFQYTKTADSAIAIGDETDYSTDEKIIGTWIDGKPIYQKTLDLGSNGIQVPNNTWVNTGISISNLDKIINAFGGAHPTSSAFYPLMADYDFDTYNNIQFQACRMNNSVTIRYATVQYTKTS